MSEKLKINILTLYPDNKGHRCGYCNAGENSFSFGFVTEEYSPIIYEEMMMNGWRRCGDYTYKPNLEKSCCKSYTCRLNVLDYKMSKQQRKVIKNFRKYLKGEKNVKINNNSDNIIDKNKENKNKKPLNNIYVEELEKFCQEFYVNNINIIKNSFSESTKNDELCTKKIKVILSANQKLYDLSSNLLIIILNKHFKFKNNKIKGKKEKKEPNILSLTQLETAKKIFELIKEKFKTLDEKYKISLYEKTGHINFQCKNKEEYKMYFKTQQQSKTAQNINNMTAEKKIDKAKDNKNNNNKNDK